MSDSAYKLDRQNNIRNEAAIHSYLSSTFQDLGNIVHNYARSIEAKCLIVPTGHKSIDRGPLVKKAAGD